MSASRAPLPDSSSSLPSGSPMRRLATCPAGRCSSDQQHAAGARAGAAVADRLAAVGADRLGADAAVVPSACQLSDLMRARSPRHVLGALAGDVERDDAGQLAQPGELAAGVAARARLHRLDVAAQQLPRTRAPGGRSATRRRRRRARTSSAAPARDHRVDAGVDARVQRLALHRQAGEQRRVAGVGGPQPAGAVGAAASRAGVEQLERADDAAGASVGRDRARRPRGSRRRARRAAPRRPRAASCARPALADAGSRRRAQVELGERGAQVQAGAADDDRRGARRRAAPSISAWASRGVVAGAEASR